MTSTFRLTKAEFKKIFKRPSVYIMALILLATIFISLYIFDPISIPNPTIDYSQNTASDYYNYFYGDYENSKSSIEEIYYEATDIINYYSILTEKNKSLNSCYLDIIEHIAIIRNETSATRKSALYNELKTYFDNFYTYYKDFDNFKDNNNTPYSHINLTLNYINHRELIKTLVHIDEDLDTLTPDNFIKSYDNNKYEEGLKTLLNNGINFNITTFKGIYRALDEYIANYSEYIAKGSYTINATNKSRIDTQNVLKDLQTYFDLVINFKTPIVLISETERLAMKNLIDEAIVTIDLSVTNQDIFPKQVEAHTNFVKLNILNNLDNFINNITQVEVNNYLVNNINETLKLVNTNRAKIISKIEESADEGNINDIQFAVSEYKLLATAFAEYTTDKIMLNITNNYDTSIYTAFANYNFDEFNKYQCTERLTKNTYYITNNIYANSFGNNFAFNQNSTTADSPNAYDFVYFCMEICTIIIIVFAMMLICNLITGETESGTIKLLLVRPYKRSKIITSKLFATLYFVILFMLFSFAISFAGGYFLFGIESSQPILTVFNATKAFVISPLGLIILNMLSLLLEVIFYVIMALLFAILFRNYAGAVTTSLVFIILMFVLNLLAGNAFWYTLLPGMNLHLFKFFGNAFTPISESSILQNILITGIESSMTFVYSILMYLAYNIIFALIAYTIFAKRDF